MKLYDRFAVAFNFPLPSPLICTSATQASVREEPNSVQWCQFRFLHQSLPSSRTGATRKIREKIRGVFGRFEKHFSGPKKFTRKESREFFGPEKFSGLLRNVRRGPSMSTLVQKAWCPSSIHVLLLLLLLLCTVLKCVHV